MVLSLPNFKAIFGVFLPLIKYLFLYVGAHTVHLLVDKVALASYIIDTSSIIDHAIDDLPVLSLRRSLLCAFTVPTFLGLHCCCSGVLEAVLPGEFPYCLCALHMKLHVLVDIIITT